MQDTEEPSSLEGEVRSAAALRRTFAIISHPDAGKTTLTEKLLLYSGMIRTAGMVRGRKGGKTATSDWMSMEQERGISITASAMQFPYKGATINVLDTPGHQDFCEDTYRTLTAADSAIMVIDAAKGVETQTRKLFPVCRMRGIPVLTFINKMDVPGRDPLDLMTEVEDVLGIQACAVNWPAGSGSEFQGVAERANRELLRFSRAATGGAAKAIIERAPLAEMDQHLEPEIAGKLRADLELLDGAGNLFERDKFLSGQVTPVFFGSALTNFGVEPFFDAFVKLAPPPGVRLADRAGGGELAIDPAQNSFSAYVFKLQGNMDPRHRDSIAFMRVCSGRFERDMVVKHHRLDKKVRLARSHSMFARERNTVDLAYPGDIVGVINPGIFAIGDTISLSGGYDFKPLPQFMPEVFAQVRPTTVAKRKSFDKGMLQFTQEGTVQLLRRWDTDAPFVAAVGRLQFEVLQYRMRDEYGVETYLEMMPYECSAWLEGDAETFQSPTNSLLAKDQRGRPVVMFGGHWEKNYAISQNPNHRFLNVS